MDLGAFVAALCADWVGLMSGAASILLTIGGFFGSSRHQRRMFWIFAGACFFIASLRVWTIEHRRADALQTQLEEQTRPHLSCEIDTVSTGFVAAAKAPYALIKLIAKVRNIGAQSTAEQFRLNITLSNGTVINGVPATISDKMSWRYPNGTVEIMHRTDNLDEKTSQPISHNSYARGNLMFMFPTMTSQGMFGC
jgi:hypothetical protein